MEQSTDSIRAVAQMITYQLTFRYINSPTCGLGWVCRLFKLTFFQSLRAAHKLRGTKR